MRAWPLAGFVNANAKACCAFGNIIRSDVECFTFPGGAILDRDGDVFDQVVVAFIREQAGGEADQRFADHTLEPGRPEQGGNDKQRRQPP